MKHDATAEAALVSACRRRDDAAFGRLIDLYQARIYGFVKRMVHDAEDAQDLTQEVFIRAYQGLDRFDGRSSLRTWLFRIATNLCIDQSRRLNHTLEVVSGGEEEAWDNTPDHRWDPETAALSAEMHDVVEHALAQMSDKLRMVLLLHDREDMAYEEIAATMSLPVGTVKSRLFLARESLQKTLKNYIGAPGGQQ